MRISRSVATTIPLDAEFKALHSRIGGEADKLGYRYEMLWAVEAALDLIDGEFVDLVVEPIGDEAAGVEFYRTDPAGIQEYHSIKRQQIDGNWTLNRLALRVPVLAVAETRMIAIGPGCPPHWRQPPAREGERQ